MWISLRRCWILGIPLLWGLLSGAWAGAPFEVRVGVEKTRVFLGESFLFQIQIEGASDPVMPDLSALRDFTVQAAGQQIQTTTVNWQTTTTLILNYRLTPLRTGLLTIPSLTITANGKTASTQPVRIEVIPPQETRDFKLRLSLSESRCYVGQPITLTVTWYLAKDVQGFEMQIPVLSDPRFTIRDLPIEIDPREKDRYLSLAIAGRETIAKKGRSHLDGIEYLTVSFQKILIPREAGKITLPQATVTLQAVVGYKERRRPGNPFFDDFFKDFFDHDFFGPRKEAILQKVIVPSNTPLLEVLPLPTEGRPPHFTGLVGVYQIAVQATPTEVSVGDPITLTIQIVGPGAMEDVQLPPLEEQPALARDFKIPKEMAAGKVEGNLKTFTQTIRALHAGIREIPPIEIAYFDPVQGRYAIAKSEPIPIRVSSARIVTAADAEGRTEEAPRIKSELQQWAEGIAHNYEGPEVLVSHRKKLVFSPRSPFWLAVVLLPPLFYLLLSLGASYFERRLADPQAMRSRRAYRVFVGEIRRLRAIDPKEGPAELLEALRNYLGDRLGLPSASLTFKDVRDLLPNKNLEETSVQQLQDLFTFCEAHAYAGGSVKEEEWKHALQEAESTITAIERRLR